MLAVTLELDNGWALKPASLVGRGMVTSPLQLMVRYPCALEER